MRFLVHVPVVQYREKEGACGYYGKSRKKFGH